MKLDSDLVKKTYQAQVDSFNREIAVGRMEVERITKQVTAMQEQILRIEGAKIAVEQLLGVVVNAEKAQVEAETAARTAKIPSTADEVTGQRTSTKK